VLQENPDSDEEPGKSSVHQSVAFRIFSDTSRMTYALHLDEKHFQAKKSLFSTFSTLDSVFGDLVYLDLLKARNHVGVVKSLTRCYKRPFEDSSYTIIISIKEGIQWKKNH